MFRSRKQAALDKWESTTTKLCLGLRRDRLAQGKKKLTSARPNLERQGLFFFFFFFFFLPGSGIELKKKVEESWLQYKGLLDNGLSTSTYRYICTIDR